MRCTLPRWMGPSMWWSRRRRRLFHDDTGGDNDAERHCETCSLPPDRRADLGHRYSRRRVAADDRLRLYHRRRVVHPAARFVLRRVTVELWMAWRCEERGLVGERELPRPRSD